MNNNLSKWFYNVANIFRWYTATGLITSIATMFFVPHIMFLKFLPTFLSMSLVCIGSNMLCKNMEKEEAFQNVINRLEALSDEGYEINIELDSEEDLEYYRENPDKLNKLIDELVRIADAPEDDVDVQIYLNENGEPEFYFKDDQASESLIQMVIERAKQMAKEEGINLTDEDISEALNKITTGETDNLIDGERYPEYPGAETEEEQQEEQNSDDSNDLDL